MAREYFWFIDWMKAAGICLIVVGHVAARPINGLTPPIYPKQLGVAFFLFVLGFSLAREHRRAAHVLFNRLFEVYLFGIPIALVLSAVAFLERGTFALSNYLPFVLGANVLFNNFPANPTTWYIGTYLHVLLVWALVLRTRRIQPWMLGIAIPAEILLRMSLLRTAGEYIAYMLVSNWASVFLLGTLCGQADDAGRAKRVAMPAGALVALAIAWPLLVAPAVVARSFPFMRLSVGAPNLDAFVASACASALYVGFAWLAFLVARSVPAFSWVRFLSRNTLIVFIAHMPAFYALDELLSQSALGYGFRSLVQILVCLVGLALLSEALWLIVKPRRLRDSLGAWLFLKDTARAAP